MANFSLIFGIVLALNIVLTFRSSDWYKRWAKSGSTGVLDTIEEDAALGSDVKNKHYKLLRNYLIVYLLGTFSDWLQGPYVYALYSAYGFKQNQIAIIFLFVVTLKNRHHVCTILSVTVNLHTEKQQNNG